MMSSMGGGGRSPNISCVASTSHCAGLSSKGLGLCAGSPPPHTSGNSRWYASASSTDENMYSLGCGASW